MSFVPFQTPPPTFFTIDGIYSHRYDQSVIATFDAISTMTGSAGLPDPFNNRFNVRTGQMMSYQQLQNYREQIATFQRVYAYNYRQSTIQTVTNPATSYRFITYKEKGYYNEGIGIISKLYNDVEDLTLNQIFVFQFPPFAPSFPSP